MQDTSLFAGYALLLPQFALIVVFIETLETHSYHSPSRLLRTPLGHKQANPDIRESLSLTFRLCSYAS
jgi:hypothetical protein